MPLKRADMRRIDIPESPIPAKPMTDKVQIQGSMLLRNIGLNFVGLAAPLAVAVATIPYVVSELGPERFGVLALVGAVLGYFRVFDLGLGRSTTKFISEALGSGESHRIPAIFWTSMSSVLVLGAAGALLFAGLSPLLVDRVFNVPPELRDEMKLVFFISAAGVMVTMVRASLVGVLEAFQRFGILNAIRAPSSIASYLIIVSVLLLGGGLPLIVFSLLMKDALVLLIYMVPCWKAISRSGTFVAFDVRIAPSLFSFGGWLTLHNISGYIIIYGDRALVPVLLTLTALTYYTVPFDLVARFSILSTAVMAVLFPGFSTLHATDRDQLERLFWKALKYISLVAGLIMSVLIFLSEDILVLWLGSDFERSTLVLQILAVSFFASALSWLLSTLLQGAGYIKMVTLIVLPMVPLQVFLTWLLTVTLGIEGTALSTIAPKIIGILFFYRASRAFGLIGPFPSIGRRHMKLLTAFVPIGAMVAVKLVFDVHYVISGVLALAFILGYIAAVWRYAVDDGDKQTARHVIRKYLTSHS